MADEILNEAEARVLGCLLEKEMATPEYYPLSLLALVNACNQKSSREPVVSYDDMTVVRACAGLQAKQLLRQSNVSRVPKYEHNFNAPRNMVAREAAIICVLLLRGPQTVGEIRTRTERLCSFADLEEVAATLVSLEEMGLVKILARQPGRKEPRYAHLLCGEPADLPTESIARPEPATLAVRAENDRIAVLEEDFRQLQQELAALQQQFAEFKAQFE
ncbi:MAG: hypothetical protein A2521_16170 [Deltaproteobacteria bacterium RIFOXYD12_FULL_57_12]|nr:MAG: hypothetical protein A2521_16170 [Deltaproteobacteria bacterium RIFOXYD12_FULL_57_12]